MEKNQEVFPNLRVLVIEDYYFNQELLKDILMSMECEVDIAENGKLGLEMYQQGNFDLVLVDIRIAEVDGYEVTKKIREIEGKNKKTIIVAVTANALPGDKEKCLTAGADDYLMKPVNEEMIEELLRKFFPLRKGYK